MAELGKMVPQAPRSPPGLLLLPRCSRAQQGKLLIQEDLIWTYTIAETLAQEGQYVWTGTAWEFLDEKLLFGTNISSLRYFVGNDHILVNFSN